MNSDALKQALWDLHKKFVARYGRLWALEDPQSQNLALKEHLERLEGAKATPQEVERLCEWALDAPQYQESPPVGGQVLRCLLDLREMEKRGGVLRNIDREFSVRWRQRWKARKIHHDQDLLEVWARELERARITEDQAREALREIAAELLPYPPSPEQFIARCRRVQPDEVIYRLACGDRIPGVALTPEEEHALHAAVHDVGEHNLRAGSNAAMSEKFLRVFRAHLVRTGAKGSANESKRAQVPVQGDDRSPVCEDLADRVKSLIQALEEEAA